MNRRTYGIPRRRGQIGAAVGVWFVRSAGVNTRVRLRLVFWRLCRLPGPSAFGFGGVFGGWAKSVSASSGARILPIKSRPPVILSRHRRAKDPFCGVVAVSASGNTWPVAALPGARLSSLKNRPPVILSRHRRAKDPFCDMRAVSASGNTWPVAAPPGARRSSLKNHPPVILSRHRRAKDLFCGMRAVWGRGDTQAHCRIARS